MLSHLFEISQYEYKAYLTQSGLVTAYGNRDQDQYWLNSLRARLFSRNINMDLQFLSFLHTDTTQVAEILSHVRQ